MLSVTVHLALQLEAMDSYDSLMVLLKTVVTNSEPRGYRTKARGRLGTEVIN